MNTQDSVVHPNINHLNSRRAQSPLIIARVQIELVHNKQKQAQSVASQEYKSILKYPKVYYMYITYHIFVIVSLIIIRFSSIRITVFNNKLESIQKRPTN